MASYGVSFFPSHKKMKESPSKRQNREESSILCLVMDSHVVTFFVEVISHQLFARLSRCCKKFKGILAIFKTQKIDQLLALYASRTGEVDRLVGVSRAYRMFRDNQITESQYRTLYNTFYLNDCQRMLDLDKRDEYGSFMPWRFDAFSVWNPPVSCFRWSENSPVDQHLQSLKQIRYPDPLEIMPLNTTAFALELACQGYDLWILGRIVERRTGGYHAKTYVGKWNSLEDIDFWTVKQLCEKIPRLYQEFPDHIIQMLVNEEGNATWLQIPRLISVEKFVSLRTQPYELADILRLGFSAKEFSTVKTEFNMLPPVSVMAWLHSYNPYFLVDPEANHLRLAFVPIVRVLEAKESFRYVLTSGLAKGLLTRLKAEATSLAIDNVIANFKIFSTEEERLQFLY